MNSPRNSLPGVTGARTVVSVWCATLLICIGTVHGQQLLRWKFMPGDSWSYRFSQNTKTETAGAGKTIQVILNTAMTVTWKVESVDADRGAKVIQSIDRFSVTMTTDKLEPIRYDSASKVAPVGPAREIADGISRFLGATCRLQISERGEIVAVEPSAEFQQALAASKPSASNAATVMLTPEGMSQMLRQAAFVLPEKPLAEGGAWDSATEAPVGLGTLLQQTKFTYHGPAEIDGGKADKITGLTTFTLQPDAKQAGPKIKEGSQSGTWWFDSSAGRVVRSELAQRLVTERPYRDTTIRVLSTSDTSVTVGK